MRVRVVRIDKIARSATYLALAPLRSQRLPPFAAGSHIRISVPKLPDAKAAPFSLTGSMDDEHEYQIVVHRKGNGESVADWLHNEAQLGDTLDVSEPKCGLRLNPEAAHHCLVAGGSGIAALFPHMAALRRQGAHYELHYAFRNEDEGIWRDALRVRHGDRVREYVATEGERLNLSRLLSAQPPGTHVYVCGPPRLIQSVVDAARHSEFPFGAIHWDAYGWQPDLEVSPEPEMNEVNKGRARSASVQEAL